MGSSYNSWIAAIAVFSINLMVAACQTPKILTDGIPAKGCNPNTEHTCAGGGCCWLNFDCCGKQYANEPAICEPDDACSDANYPPPNDFEAGAASHWHPKVAPQRHP